MIGTIYKYTSPNGKSYIGQTRQTMKRRAERGGRKYRESTAFYSAINKYGFENFTVEILETVESDDLDTLIDTLNALETKLIKEHKTLCPNGYNIDIGGSARVVAQETRDKIKRTLTGKKHTPERRLNQSLARIGKQPWNKGKKIEFSEERKAQQAAIGYKSLHERWHVNRNIIKDGCTLCV